MSDKHDTGDIDIRRVDVPLFLSDPSYHQSAIAALKAHPEYAFLLIKELLLDPDVVLPAIFEAIPMLGSVIRSFRSHFAHSAVLRDLSALADAVDSIQVNYINCIIELKEHVGRIAREIELESNSQFVNNLQSPIFSAYLTQFVLETLDNVRRAPFPAKLMGYSRFFVGLCMSPLSRYAELQTLRRRYDALTLEHLTVLSCLRSAREYYFMKLAEAGLSKDDYATAHSYWVSKTIAGEAYGFRTNQVDNRVEPSISLEMLAAETKFPITYLRAWSVELEQLGLVNRVLMFDAGVMGPREIVMSNLADDLADYIVDIETSH